jgi:hypothetical protein
MSMKDEVAGACLCGSVRFRVRLPSLFCAHCHCSMCRRNHGAGYVTWFAVRREQLTVDQGQANLIRFASSEQGTRSFCKDCGTSLFCDNTAYPDRIDIALGTVDEPIDRPPQLHVFFDSRAPWVQVDDGLPRLGGRTGFEPLKDSGEPEEGTS